MTYYHVRISRKSANNVETRLDLSHDELESRVLVPYRNGLGITLGGTTIESEDINRLQISRSNESSEELRPIVRQERAASGVVSNRSIAWYIARRGEDVTDSLIMGPPGYAVTHQANYPVDTTLPTDSREVFVVHGRNLAARDALFSFLRAIDLQPIEWIQAIQDTGKPTPYIGEILDAAFSRASAIVVLMTPDDEARLKSIYQGGHEPPFETELSGQARPNVLFEAGMAMGRNQDRTVLVELGVLRPFSDIAGRHAVRLDNTPQRRQELANRLALAGCPVKLDGSDWYDAGDFAVVN